MARISNRDMWLWHFLKSIGNMGNHVKGPDHFYQSEPTHIIYLFKNWNNGEIYNKSL